MVRVWKFLDPSTGEHTLSVKRIGTPEQKVTLDGQVLPSSSGQVTFVGPGGFMLQLKQEVETRFFSTQSTWSLFVNDRRVEEVASTCDGLRDMRHMAEGSYTIATGFSAAGIRRYACRKFKFLVDGKAHVVVVSYLDSAWQVSLDGVLVDREGRGLLDTKRSLEFDVPAGSRGAKLRARLDIALNLKDFLWTYALSVGGEPVPAAWTKFVGRVRGATVPHIYSGEPLESLEPAACEAEDDDEDERESQKENQCPCTLPQGVGYDAAARSYQATIMDPKTKRFVLLGEFGTPEAAHQTYVEALARYAPDKMCAPVIA